MYSKNINGVLTINSCRTLKLNGVWVSNPTPEMIYADGWQDYIPPAREPQPQAEPDFDAVISDLKAYIRADVDALTDEQALAVKSLFPTFPEFIGREVNPGLRIWYDGNLYKCIQFHTVQAEWTPDTTPAMWTKVSLEEFPEWVQPTGAQDAYNTGDKVSHNGNHWESDYDGNVWEPGIFGWVEL